MFGRVVDLLQNENVPFAEGKKNLARLHEHFFLGTTGRDRAEGGDVFDRQTGGGKKSRLSR